MIIEVMCRIADGPLRPGELEVTQAAAPLVSWSVNSRDGSEAWELPDDTLPIELHFPDNTVWTGEVYPVAYVEPNVKLRGIGPLSEDSIPVHADVVIKRIETMLAARQS